MFLGELYEWVAQEGDALRFGVHHFHEGAHDAIGDGCGQASHAVAHEVVLWKINTEEGA